MGTEMVAFVEYDKSRYYAQLYPAGPLPLPFGEAVDVESLSQGGPINTGSKDYRFFAALAGVRNLRGIPPLFLPRGLPSRMSHGVQWYLRDWGNVGEHSQGWLLVEEVDAALKHHGLERDDLSFESQTLLAILDVLSGRLGKDCVRLVLGFES